MLRLCDTVLSRVANSPPLVAAPNHICFEGDAPIAINNDISGAPSLLLHPWLCLEPRLSCPGLAYELLCRRCFLTRSDYCGRTWTGGRGRWASTLRWSSRSPSCAMISQHCTGRRALWRAVLSQKELHAPTEERPASCWPCRTLRTRLGIPREARSAYCHESFFICAQ
jgi:hypothetical protein